MEDEGPGPRKGRRRGRGLWILAAGIAVAAGIPPLCAWFGWYSLAFGIAFLGLAVGAPAFLGLAATAIPKVAEARPGADRLFASVLLVVGTNLASGWFLAPRVHDASVAATRERGAALHARLRAFQVAKGRWPSTLSEVEADGRGPRERPTLAPEFDYDRNTGDLGFESGMFPFSRSHVFTEARFGWTERATSD